MFNFNHLHRSKPQAITEFLPGWLRPVLKASAAVTLAVGVISKPALADPDIVPPQPQFPPIFCFRITDIREVKSAPQGNRFRFEFEVLNWTDTPAYDLDIALNTGTSNGLFFANPGVDQNGAPLGSDPTDWGGRPLPPGSPALRMNHTTPPPNVTNDWSVTNSTSTYIRWDNGLEPPIDSYDIAVQGYPAWITKFTTPAQRPASLESVDNGFNVLDGFTFTVDNFDPGETLSFNWFLTDVNGNPIATAQNPNPSKRGGFGTFNLARVDGGILPNPTWALFTNGSQFNTGFQQSQTQFYDSVYNVPDPASFAAEFGAGGTAPFKNQADSERICGPGGCAVNVPEPSNTAAMGLAGLAMFGYGWRRRKESK